MGELKIIVILIGIVIEYTRVPKNSIVKLTPMLKINKLMEPDF